VGSRQRVERKVVIERKEKIGNGKKREDCIISRISYLNGLKSLKNERKIHIPRFLRK
jgi:hypothetical protein